MPLGVYACLEKSPFAQLARLQSGSSKLRDHQRVSSCLVVAAPPACIIRSSPTPPPTEGGLARESEPPYRATHNQSDHTDYPTYLTGSRASKQPRPNSHSQSCLTTTWICAMTFQAWLEYIAIGDNEARGFS